VNDLLRRQRALQKTLAKYRGKPFAWGRADCLRMVRSHLVAMRRRGLPKVPRYRSVLGAKRALKATGHANLEGLLDSLLPRIAPAEMLPGDVALMGGDEHFDAITISVGRKVFGFHQDAEGAVVMTPHEIKAAWRA